MSLQSFKRYLQFEKRYSEHTITSYESDLKQAFAYLAHTFEIQGPELIEPEHLRSWVVDLISKQRSARTVNRKISSLRMYFRHLIRSGTIVKDPTIRLRSLKLSKRLPRHLQRKEVAAISQDPGEFTDHKSLRNHFIIKTFYATGIRRAELISLRVKDIDWDKGCLLVRGKGNKERLVPISENFATELKAYLKKREQYFPRAEPLFVTDQGKILYPKLIYNIVRNYLSAVSTVDQKGPHTLRHTFATHLLDEGADLQVIKELLGHSNLAATQVYTHNSAEKLKKAYALAHPKAKA